MTQKKYYILVRISDGYRLNRLFKDKAGAILHAEQLFQVTGNEYEVVAYIGPTTLLRAVIGYM